MKTAFTIFFIIYLVRHYGNDFVKLCKANERNYNSAFIDVIIDIALILGFVYFFR